MYRVRGRLVKETLGTLANIPKVEEARRRAAASLEKAREGVDPVVERRAAVECITANTVAAAAEHWLAQCERDLKPKTVIGYRQIHVRRAAALGRPAIVRDRKGRRTGIAQRQGCSPKAQPRRTDPGCVHTGEPRADAAAHVSSDASRKI